jgi:hypothetical protein
MFCISFLPPQNIHKWARIREFLTLTDLLFFKKIWADWHGTLHFPKMN